MQNTHLGICLGLTLAEMISSVGVDIGVGSVSLGGGVGALGDEVQSRGISEGDTMEVDTSIGVTLAVEVVAVSSGAGDRHVGSVDARGGLEAVHVAHGVVGGVEAGHGGEDGGGENQELHDEVMQL